MIPATAVQNPLSKHQEMPKLKLACLGYNIHTLQECHGEKQQSNTKFRRANTMLKNGNTQIKVTTPITMASHEQCHHNYSDDQHSQANTIVIPYKSVMEKSNKARPTLEE